MRISAKIVLFLRILRLLVVAHTSSREKSSDDAFHSFFVSFGLKHFASLLYTQKDKYNPILYARSKAKNERYGDAFFVRCDDDNDDAIVFVEHRVVVLLLLHLLLGEIISIIQKPIKGGGG